MLLLFYVHANEQQLDVYFKGFWSLYLYEYKEKKRTDTGRGWDIGALILVLVAAKYICVHMSILI